MDLPLGWVPRCRKSFFSWHETITDTFAKKLYAGLSTLNFGSKISSMHTDHDKQIWLHEDFTEHHSHRVVFTNDLLRADNDVLATILARRDDEPVGGVLLVVDSNVADAWPTFADDFAQKIASFQGPTFRHAMRIPGGEDSKNDPAVFDALFNAIDSHHIDRASWVVVVGGGAAIDTAGLAAATAHRGVRLLRIATTVLAQLDAAIGVKNGVNRLGKKNFVGSFAIPEAVICDESFLATLSDREWRCGFSEAVKIACLQSRDFLTKISHQAEAIRARDMVAANGIIFECAERHLKHITQGGDPFERREGRPLDFGHWSGHRLESMTNFSVKHGEAVAIGVAIDTLYSVLDGRLSEEDGEFVIATLESLGLPVYHETLNETEGILEGLEEFREHLGGRLTITLLNSIGSPTDVHEMDHVKIREAIRLLATR
jgi:3-dehydroquinate synthase